MSSKTPTICKKLTIYNDSILINYKNMHQYFNKIYVSLKNEIKGMNMECVNIKDIFNGILRKNNDIFKQKSGSSVSNITNDTISLIKLPSLPAEYHFIVAVVYNDIVVIYQAYGNRSLYKLKLPLSEFIKYIEMIEEIVHSETPYSLDVIDKIKDIEKNLYDIDIDKYISEEIDRTTESDDEEDYEELKEEYFEDYYNMRWQNSENFTIETYSALPVKNNKSLSLKRSTKKSKSITYRKIKSI